MIKLTQTEALFIENTIQETLFYLENEESPPLNELREALEIIKSCNIYDEMQMLEE